jgi:hypothetical protein
MVALDLTADLPDYNEAPSDCLIVSYELVCACVCVRMQLGLDFNICMHITFYHVSFTVGNGACVKVHVCTSTREGLLYSRKFVTRVRDSSVV